MFVHIKAAENISVLLFKMQVKHILLVQCLQSFLWYSEKVGNWRRNDFLSEYLRKRFSKWCGTCELVFVRQTPADPKFWSVERKFESEDTSIAANLRKVFKHKSQALANIDRNRKRDGWCSGPSTISEFP